MTVTLDDNPAGTPGGTLDGALDDTGVRQPPAQWPARAGAFGIDVLLGVAVLVCLLMVGRAAPAQGWLWWACMVAAAAVLLGIAVNRLLLPAATGWSLGRCVFGIAVTRRDGSRPGPWRLMLRDAAHLLDTATLFGGWLWPLLDSRGRTFADLLLGTEVRAVDGPRPDCRGPAARLAAGAALTALLAAGVGYLAVYRPQLAAARARDQIAVEGPRIVADMLSYTAKTVGDDFARAQSLVTDDYRPKLTEQQQVVRKAGPVDNDYWVTDSAVLSAAQDRASMLLLLQGQRGAPPKQRFITASVRVGFARSAAGRWQVADLTVLSPLTAPPAANGGGR